MPPEKTTPPDASMGNPPNPAFGSGFARRRVRLTGTPGAVFAELEDHAHAMRLRLFHSDGTITAIEPDFHRVPMNTCPSAAEPLSALLGEPIGQPLGAFFGGGRARRNCTHMFDLAWLAQRHAMRGATTRLYAIDIPDRFDDRQEISATCDGALLFRLIVEDGMIVSPEPFAGRHLFRGFAPWLTDSGLSDAEIEAAVMLQKVSLIIPARRWQFGGGPLGEAERQFTTGLCHGYAAETIDRAYRLGDNIRDFSAEPEELLRFR